MVRSMTGFGEASALSASVTYFVEVRSLNSKYLKSIIRLPEEFQGLEAEIETILRHKLRRGTVTCIVTVSDASESAAYTVNHKALSSYIQQIQQAPQVSGGAVKIEIGPLLTLPGVLQPPANEEARIDRTRKETLPLVEKACARVIVLREQEGRMLATELLTQRDVIAIELEKVKGRAPQMVLDYELRLKQRVESMLTAVGVAVQPFELIREIAIFAERTDIREETTRLGGHIDQFAQLVHASGDQPVGRTLDFLAQEMLREANTMGAKSADSEISRSVVAIKGAIDRIKEQVQNLE